MSLSLLYLIINIVFICALFISVEVVKRRKVYVSSKSNRRINKLEDK